MQHVLKTTTVAYIIPLRYNGLLIAYVLSALKESIGREIVGRIEDDSFSRVAIKTTHCYALDNHPECVLFRYVQTIAG